MDLIEACIRDVEINILDKYHENQPLLQRSQIEAISHILKVYGNILREFDLAESNQTRTGNRLTEEILLALALEQCLRWVLTSCKLISSSSQDSWQIIDEEAMSLISWARLYVKLCADYTALFRGYYIATLNEALHEIRFDYKNIIEFTVYSSQMAAYPFHVNEVFNILPKKEIDDIFHQWKGKVNLTELHLPEKLPDFENVFSVPNQLIMLEWSRATILPELDNSENLHGFTLGDLRIFWACLFLKCYLIANLESYVDETIGSENDLGSVMLQGHSIEFSEYLGEYFKMDSITVLRIIDCLTFDESSHKSTLSNSPFIKTKCGAISILCRRVVKIDPYIMISSSLAKRSRKSIYEALVHKIEKINVTNVGTQFQNIGFTVIIEGIFKSKENVKICPDLIVYDQYNHQILIVDYKHAIPPIGAGEVGNRIRDLEKWKDQIRRYLTFFSKNEDIIKSKLKCTKISQVYGMLLFRWGMPIPVVTETDIAIRNDL